jgi:DNA-directed RNA polymerase specialized sigma24 family protein
MAISPASKTGENKTGIQTPETFRKFLNWLDGGIDSEGQRYLEIRRRLVHYFDRKNCVSPDDLADETLNRVARRLQEEGTIDVDTPAHYCYIVAHYVFLESLRHPQAPEPLNDRLLAPSNSVEERSDAQRRSNCLNHCLQNLNADDRALIIDYYEGDKRVKIENRKNMATKMGITLNALSIRACRIRDKLETCVSECMNRRNETF